MKCRHCGYQVARFKSNAHVIPRWAMKLTKDNGLYRRLGPLERRIGQEDLTTESWCYDCEDQFAILDNFGANFLKNHRYLLHPSVATCNRSLFFEAHDLEVEPALNVFLSSIVTRMYLHHIENGIGLKHFSTYSKIFKNYIYGKDNFIAITKYPDLKGAVQELLADEKSVTFALNGYHVAIHPCRSTFDRGILGLQKNHILIPFIVGSDNKVVKDLVSRFEIYDKVGDSDCL